MPVMSFDLQDGKPPVTFSLRSEDCDRFMAFMDECQAIKEQRREWVGLTDEELEVLEIKHAPPVHPDVKDDDWWEFARAIEAKLKEKNA